MEIMELGSWDLFKSLVSSKKLLIQYTEDSTGYQLSASEAGMFLWRYRILKDTDDATDFETNFKSSANAPLEIKASVGKPIRVAPSAQPVDTTESWKGFHVDNDQDNYFYFDIEFSTDVYLRGGKVHCKEAVCGEMIDVDVVLKSDNTPVKEGLLTTVPIIADHWITFMSEESLLLPSYLKLRVKYTKGSSQTSARCVTAIAQFFKPDS